MRIFSSKVTFRFCRNAAASAMPKATGTEVTEKPIPSPTGRMYWNQIPFPR